MKEDTLSITWLGHSTFRFTEPSGRITLIDPWLSNPKCPPSERIVKKVDQILLTHGHFDHLGETVEIAREHDVPVVATLELAEWLKQKGVGKADGMNTGGTIPVGGLEVTMVHADHTGGIIDGDQIIYGGHPIGFVIGFPSGIVVYHAGDTALFGDMQLIAELYRPAIAILPIGDRFTMSPRAAARACRLLRPRVTIPMHYGTFDALTGTVDAFREELRSVSGVMLEALDPGETKVFSKAELL